MKKVVNVIDKIADLLMQAGGTWYAVKAMLDTQSPLSKVPAEEVNLENEISESLKSGKETRELKIILDNISLTQSTIIKELNNFYRDYLEFRASMEGDDFFIEDDDEMYN